ncbi:MAG: diguanylate cyclase [Angustibacter sp.]
MEQASGVVAVAGAFGPLDLLSDWAHELYLDGFSGRAVVAAREAMPVAAGAGDLKTLRYLHYTCGVALIEQRRWEEAIAHAHELLAVIDVDDLAWRAKALSLLGDASLRLGHASQAVDALAEAYALVERTPPQRYNDLSATMAVGVVLGHAQLFTPAEALFRLCETSPAVRGDDAATRIARVLVLQEYSVLHATWGAALELDGRDREGRAHHVRSAELALHMMRLTDDDVPMNARAQLVEAWAQLRLGQTELAVNRLRHAMDRFELRPELPEVQIGRLALAVGLREHERFDEARTELAEVLDGAQLTDRIVWELAALSAMALTEVAEHGDHPAREYYERARRAASHRLWVERESRFFALRDRISLRALAAEASQLGQDALIDPLTGLGNRRMLDAGIAESLGGAALFVDVDLFKQVNDRYSHSVGDEVLRRIADILRAQCRAHDVVVRFGGDEFVVLLPATSAQEAAAVAERVRSAVAREPWDDVQPGLGVSVSVGVAASDASADKVLKDADAALYEAKESGRNRVTVY